MKILQNNRGYLHDKRLTLCPPCQVRMRPKSDGLSVVYEKASSGEASLWEAWTQELKPTTWLNVQRGY